jgi:K+-sensing histidine kinase KdpD
VWNDGSRLVIYLGVAVLVDRLWIERERLRERDSQREELLSVLETELQRPSLAMEGALDSLESHATTLAPAQRDAVRALRHHARDVAFLAGDFLAIGDLHAGRAPVRLLEIDPRQLVRDAVRESRDADRVALVTSGDALMIRGDEDRLRHARASIISCALRTPSVDVNMHLRQSGDEVALDLDSQAPITAADMQLARLLWEANGGTMTVGAWKVGVGTSVRMRLPIAMQPAATAGVAR